MSVPKSFTFFSGEINGIDWSVTDLNGAVVNSATVTTTLYWGRDRIKPESVPGIPVDNFNAINLVFSSPKYSAQVIFSAPNGGDYIMVVDVKSGSTPLGHYEIPSVVLRGGQ